MVANRHGWKVRAPHDQAWRLSEGGAAGRSGAENPSAHSYRRRGGRLRATQGPGRLLGRSTPRRSVLAELGPDARTSGGHGQPIDRWPGGRSGVVASARFIALKYRAPLGLGWIWGMRAWNPARWAGLRERRPSARMEVVATRRGGSLWLEART